MTQDTHKNFPPLTTRLNEIHAETTTAIADLTSRVDELEERQTAILTTPQISDTVLIPNTASTIILSASSLLAEISVVGFEVTFLGKQQTVPAVTGTATVTITAPADALEGDRLLLECRAKDNHGNFSREASREYEVVCPAIASPVITFPDGNTSSVMPDAAIGVGSFLISLAGYDTPRVVDNFRYAYKADDDTIIEQGYKTLTAQGGTLAPANDLPLRSDVTLETQWLGEKLESPVSVVKFTTIDASIAMPVFSGIMDGATAVSLTQPITIEAFSVKPDGFDMPLPQDNLWYAFKNADDETVLEQGYKTFPATGGIIAPANPYPPTTNVVIEAFWRSKRLESPKATLSFTTLTPTIAAPIFSGVTDGAIDVPLKPSISVEAFDIFPAGFDVPKSIDNFAYTFTLKGKTEAEDVILESGFKTFPATGGAISPATDLPAGAVVALAAHWIGEKSEGAESQMEFATLDAFINAPTMTGISDGETWVLLQPNITLEPFSVVPKGFDEPKDNDNFWYRYETKDGTVLDEGFKTLAAGGSFQPAVSLSLITEYRLRGKWLGKKMESAETVINFTTADSHVAKPVLIKPSEGGVLRATDLTLATSPFKGIGCEHAATDWLIDQTEDPNNPYYGSPVLDSTDKLIHDMTKGGISTSSLWGKEVTCFARHKPDRPVAIDPPWSDPVHVRLERSVLMAFGQSGAITTSKDGFGEIWSPDVTVSGQTGAWRGAAWGNGTCVVVGDGGKFSTSTDTRTWTPATAVSGQTGSWHDACYAKGKFIAVGDGGKIAVPIYGEDRIELITVSGQTGAWRKIVYGNGIFVVVGDGGKFSTSTDTRTWTPATAVSGQTGSWHDACYGDGKFVIVGDGSKIATSTTGVNWSQPITVSGSKTPPLRGVAWSDYEGFAAVGGAQEFGGNWYTTSRSGASWATLKQVATESANTYWTGVSWSSLSGRDGQFVASGVNGRFAGLSGLYLASDAFVGDGRSTSYFGITFG